MSKETHAWSVSKETHMIGKNAFKIIHEQRDSCVVREQRDSHARQKFHRNYSWVMRLMRGQWAKRLTWQGKMPSKLFMSKETHTWSVSKETHVIGKTAFKIINEQKDSRVFREQRNSHGTQKIPSKLFIRKETHAIYKKMSCTLFSNGGRFFLKA